MARCFSGIDAPVTVQGRQGGKRSRLTVAVYRTEDGRLRVRLDDELDPGFWAEVMIDPAKLPPSIDVYEPVQAADSRYAK